MSIIDLAPFRQSYDANSVKTKFGIKDHNYVVRIAANFSRPIKKVDIFIKAEVVKAIPNVTFMILGDGYLRKELECLTEQLGLTKKIIFTGLRDFIYPIRYSKAWVKWYSCIPR